MGDYLFFMDLTGYYIACNTARQTRICNSNLSINFSVNGRGAKGLKDRKRYETKGPISFGQYSASLSLSQPPEAWMR